MRSALCTIRRLLSRRAPWSLLWQSLTWQGALIAVNFFLAFRGVQIWQLIQKVKVVQILHRVGWVAPLTQSPYRFSGTQRAIQMPATTSLPYPE